LGGIAAIVAVVLVAGWILTWNSVKAADLSAVVSPVVSAIAALVGAFFGVNLGQAGKADAEKK
jgi:hypothetical protein